MTSVDGIGAARSRGTVQKDPIGSPQDRQSPLERLLAEPGPLDRFAVPDPVRHRADAEHGAAPLAPLIQR